MSVDPARDFVADFGSPQSFNRYSYVWNSPITLVDPSGLDPPLPCVNGVDPDTGNICAAGTTSGGSGGSGSGGDAGGNTGGDLCFYLPFFCSGGGGGQTGSGGASNKPNPGAVFSVTTYARMSNQANATNRCVFTPDVYGVYVCPGGGIQDVRNLQISYGAVPRLSSITPAIYAVYVGIAQNGQRYIGITNNIYRRGVEHARDGLRILETLADELTYFQAKATEQVLINQAGLESWPIGLIVSPRVTQRTKLR